MPPATRLHQQHQEALNDVIAQATDLSNAWRADGTRTGPAGQSPVQASV